MKARVFSDQEILNIILLYNDGISSRELGIKYNTTHGVIIKLLESRRVYIRSNKDFKRLYNFDRNFLDIINTQEKAYFLGFLYADGCFSEQDNRILIDLNIKDEEILNKFSKLLNSNYPLMHVDKKLNGKIFKSCVFHVRDEYFSERCRELGVTPRKSLTLKFPTEDQLPSFLIRHFIRGYFDGDGGITITNRKNNKSYTVHILSTHEFINKIKSIINLHIGEFGTITQHHQTKELSIFQASGNINSMNFLKWIYDGATIFLNRKYKIYQELLNQQEKATYRSSNNGIKNKEIIKRNYSINYLDYIKSIDSFKSDADTTLKEINV